MSSLETVQTIIELIQKRPMVSIISLLCLILIIFSPIILKFSPTPHQETNQKAGSPYGSISETQIYPQPNTPQASATNPYEDDEQKWVNPSNISTTQPNSPNPILATTSTLSKDKYFIVVASRPTPQSAITVATSYSNHFTPEVYQAPNGWYAVTIGHFPLEEAKRIQAQEIFSHTIPQNSWLSTGLTPGKEWLGKIYP